MSLRGSLILAAVALIAALTWWAQGRVKTGEGPLRLQAPAVPDYFMDDYSILVTGEDGRPRYRLSGRRLAHLPEDDSGVLTRPILQIFPREGPVWTIEAESGWVTGGGDEVQLHGAVRIDQPGDAATTPLRLETESLALRPQENIATTDDPVLAVSPGARVNGSGMYADLNAHRIELLAQARGVYDP